MNVTPEMLVNAVFRFATPSQKQFLAGELTRPVGGSRSSIYEHLKSLVDQHSARLPDQKAFYAGKPRVPVTIFMVAQSARAFSVKTIAETDVGAVARSHERVADGFAAIAAHLDAVMRQHGMEESGSDRLSQMMRVWQDLRAER